MSGLMLSKKKKKYFEMLSAAAVIGPLQGLQRMYVKIIKNNAFWCFDWNWMQNQTIIKVWKVKNCFYDCCHFEYLMRIYDIIKP